MIFSQLYIPTIPGELFAKFKTSFYSDPVGAAFKALGVSYSMRMRGAVPQRVISRCSQIDSVSRDGTEVSYLSL